MQLVRKITIKTCGNFTVARIKEAIAAAKLEEGQSVPLLKIVGETTSAKTGQTDKGTFTKLGGSFIGTDMTTGELYQSGVCILPDFVCAQLGTALQQGEAVRFAFEIGAQRADTSITGYSFVIKPLIETKPANAMLELMELAGIKTPDAHALAAPAMPAAAAAAPAAAPAAAAAPAKGTGKGGK